MNAFTNTPKQQTFYVKVLDQHLAQGIGFAFSDLFLRSRLGQKEIEKEKQVVLEEIRMVQDDPEDLVQDLHTKLVMGRHPLSRPILGARTIHRQDQPRGGISLSISTTHYCPEEIVVAIAGNFDQRQLEKTMARIFGGYRTSPQATFLANVGLLNSMQGGTMMEQKSLEQVHLCVGFEGIAAGHKDRYAVYALNSVLGGSVSSRLFQEIREKRGLSYSIYSFLSGYSDSGTITVYVGIRAREVERVLDLVYREIRKLTRHGIDGQRTETHAGSNEG